MILSIPFFATTVEPIIVHEPINPCTPSPCGRNSICRETNGQAVCQCVPNFIGRPPNCRPECTVNSDCPVHLACINERCKDPCPGSCGHYAECHVQSHNPSCYCLDGYQGDPFNGCSKIPTQCKKIKVFFIITYNTYLHKLTQTCTKKKLTNPIRVKLSLSLLILFNTFGFLASIL